MSDLRPAQQSNNANRLRALAHFLMVTIVVEEAGSEGPHVRTYGNFTDAIRIIRRDHFDSFDISQTGTQTVTDRSGIVPPRPRRKRNTSVTSHRDVNVQVYARQIGRLSAPSRQQNLQGHTHLRNVLRGDHGAHMSSYRPVAITSFPPANVPATSSWLYMPIILLSLGHAQGIPDFVQNHAVVRAAVTRYRTVFARDRVTLRTFQNHFDGHNHVHEDVQEALLDLDTPINANAAQRLAAYVEDLERQ